MQINWDDEIRPGDPYQAQDFRNAAYQLLSSQILYENGHGQGTAYRLIDRYREAFSAVFDLVGITLKYDPEYRFIAAIPTADRQPTQMRVADARLLLVLRKAYHERALRGELQLGAAELSIEELKEIHLAETGIELPADSTSLRFMLAPLKTFGIVKLMNSEDDDDQPFSVAILPGIVAVVTEASLGRLATYSGPELRAALAEGQDESDKEGDVEGES